MSQSFLAPGIAALREQFEKDQSIWPPLARKSWPDGASAEELKLAETMGLPQSLIDFYAHCNPDPCFEFQQRIWGIKALPFENPGALEGHPTLPKGYIVFATTDTGDQYAIHGSSNISQEPIYLLSHEDPSEAEDPSSGTLVAANLNDFLLKFANGTLQENQPTD